MSYPEEIEVPRDMDEFKELVKHSQLIRDLTEDNDETLVLSKAFFGDEQEKWELFVDIFYPHMGRGNVFRPTGSGNIGVNPSRATIQDIRDMMDYLLIDKPETMMEFAREKARQSSRAPQPELARGIGIQTVGQGARNYEAQQEALRARNDVPLYVAPEENEWPDVEPRGEGAPGIRLNSNNERNISERVETRTVPSSARKLTLNQYVAAALAQKQKQKKNRRATRRVAKARRKASRKARK